MLSYNNINLSATRYLHLLMFICMWTISSGQLNLDFNNGNINTVNWEGNISSFKINASGQLQLSASSAGESSIFTKFKVPADSIMVDLYFKMPFAPSNSNFSKIYLFTDNKTESKANGYYLKLGEDGANDAIQLWKLTNGKGVLLGSGRMGAISADPAEARVRIKIYRNGLWLLATDYKGKQLYEDDLEVMDPALSLQDSMYFGIYCKYTATRVESFFYDDIFINTIQRDTLAPVVTTTELLSESTVRLTFSKSVEERSAKDVKNYSADNGLGSPDVVIYAISAPNVVTLIYSGKKIRSGIQYLLTVNGVKDKNNNQRTSVVTFLLKVKPSPGDLILSEVLTDPYTGGEDFVELYNKSDKFLKLDSLIIKNGEKNESRMIRTDFVLLPGKYVAITKNPDFLKNTYLTPDTANFIAATLPSLNVSTANITIISQAGIQNVTLDSFDYSVKYHFSLIDATKGVSLEKINLYGESNNKYNWHSASQQYLFATPGYKNSNYTSSKPSEDEEYGIFADKKIFSPDRDGFDDFVLLNYKMKKPGYLATVKVFDAEGFPIADLTNNFLLGTEGSIKWDGIDAEGKIVRIGMYIIYSRWFHSDGEVKESKNVVVVGQKF